MSSEAFHLGVAGICFGDLEDLSSGALVALLGSHRSRRHGLPLVRKQGNYHLLVNN